MLPTTLSQTVVQCHISTTCQCQYMLELVTNIEVPTHWRYSCLSAKNVCDSKTPCTEVCVQFRQSVFRGNWERCLHCWTGSTRTCPSLLSRFENHGVAISLNEQGLSVRAPERAESNTVFLFPYTLHCTHIVYFKSGKQGEQVYA